MPKYTFENKDTGEIYEDFMTISSMEELLEKNPHIRQVPAAPQIVSGVSAGRNKPDSGFRDILKTIKKKHPRSTVNTF
jgi:hypothetical protein